MADKVNIIFYPTVNPFTFEKIIKIPENESNMIKKFTDAGFTPYVDTRRKCTDCASNGFYWQRNSRQLELFSAGKLPKGIFMLVYFNGERDTAFIESYRETFSEMLDLQYFSNRPRTRKMARLFSSRDVQPFTPQPLLEGSELFHNYSVEDGRKVNVIRGGEFEEQVNENIEKARALVDKWEKEGWGQEIKISS